MATSLHFFTQLKRLPTDIQSRIWADYFRLAAETHADNFAAVHDEMTNYSLRVNIADKIQLTLCNANNYYACYDIDDLWLNAYIFKYILEIQIKIDCLRLLEQYKWKKLKQPTVRFGDVIVRISDSLYNCNGYTLNYYLEQIPGIRDYIEDRLAYERRFRQIEWLSYVEDSWLELGVVPSRSQNNENSIDGRGVSARGLGAVGLESGTIGAEGSISNNEENTSDSDSDFADSDSDSESWRNWVPDDDSVEDDTGASGGEETGGGGLTG